LGWNLYENRRIIVKKHIWLVAGITGMLFGIPHADAKAAVNININTGSRPSFLINSPPSFIYLRTQGFSVSVGSPYDIVYYGKRYYIYHNGHWYRSYYYRGPWVLILDSGLPYQIRRHRWDDIRRYRDIEYRRSDSRTNQYQRNDDNRRRMLDQRSDANNRKVQAQQNIAPQPRPNQGPQNRAPEQRQMQNRLNKAPERQPNQGQPRKAPEQQQMQRQQNNAPQQRQNQGPQNRAPEQQQTQNQQNRGPEQRQMQRPQNNAPQQRQNQGAQNKAPENRKGPDQSNKDDRGKKN
jgi:flagellar biosynthesis GTPase FlhF